MLKSVHYIPNFNILRVYIDNLFSKSDMLSFYDKNQTGLNCLCSIFDNIVHMTRIFK